jgi:serine/threonine-protein kinase
MGVVYHAIDPNIGRPVAIKTIELGAVRNPEEQKRLCERLFREARSAGILSHPGIVTIYDVEQQGDLAYIAMEFVDGPTLDQLLSGPAPVPPEQMLSILAQTAAALDYAHQKGIVHRDIKPANIMIAPGGTAKITDFGIAKVTTSEQFTMTGSIVGTPHYMSPEQVQGQTVDGRSDQFSLAVIAFEMLTGEKPYTGEHLTTVVYKIVAEEPVPPQRLNSTLSGPIDGVLRKGLSKKPDARYRNCADFVDALEKACAGTKGWKAMPRGGSLNEPTVGPAAAPALPPLRRARRYDTTTAERATRRKSSFVPFLLAILMAAALLALIGIQAGPWRGSGSAPEETSTEAQPSSQTPAAQPQPPAPTPQAAPAQPPAAAPAPATAEEKKPSPMPPQEAPSEGPPARNQTVESAAPARATSTPRQAALQPLAIISSPSGATATLDGRPEAACHTPCSLDAAPGRHTIAITMPGYQIEHREVYMGNSPMELPPVILREPGGTLMLTSVPPGAGLTVNGKKLVETTPAQLHLAPGTYKVMVEKNGIENTSTVEIHDGETKLLRVTLGQ